MISCYTKGADHETERKENSARSVDADAPAGTDDDPGAAAAERSRSDGIRPLCRRHIDFS